MLTLHVTNGDHAAGGLARSGLPGDVLSWRDILHEGPVPPDGAPEGDPDVFRRTRAAFLAGGAFTAEDLLVDFEERDARLAGMDPDSEVVLWFEPDLYDQLQLAQILARLALRTADERPRLSIVPADLLLGSLEPPKFVPLFEARRAVRDVDLEHGLDAWRAFTQPSPMPLMAVAERLDAEISARTYGGSDDVRLPFLTSALRRQLEEYPGVEHGLSRSERQICEALSSGELSLAKLYRTAHGASESWVWLGDTTFAQYCQRLSDCAEPLLLHANGTRVVAPERERDVRNFWDRGVRLTPFGQEVVRERADAIAANGIDRWIGGTHLMTAHHWRWDGRSGRPVERSAS